MSIVEKPATQETPQPRFPTRHREAEARGVRLGRPLRRFARVNAIDEELMLRIGKGFNARDELGARLAHAMRLRAGDPARVTMQDFRLALHAGIGEVAASGRPRSGRRRCRSRTASGAMVKPSS